jgi:uncharacterized membrane protein YraQ (UPF0718 family)
MTVPKQPFKPLLVKGNTNMWEAHFYGAVLRMAQALIQASPFIVAGLFVTGVLRRLLGRTNTRVLFGADTWRSLPQAWAIGMLLPVCSFGVIPMVRELRRCGLSGGTILAFALSAPLFNPLSLLYGLTLSEPFVILAFAFCSLVLVTGIGLVWDRICPGSAITEEPQNETDEGLKRLLSIGVVGAREMCGPTLIYLLIGLIGVGVLSLALPPASMQRSVGHDNPWAPVIMAAVAIPAYASPMTAISQIGSMFQHGNSIGAAFTLLALGAGVNLGLVAWMTANYGARKASLWFVLLLAIVAVLSYGIERPLYPQGVEAAEHTHAFDVYCRPFDEHAVNIPLQTWLALRENTQLHEAVGLALLGIFASVGVLLRIIDPREQFEAWLERPSLRQTTTAWHNRKVPTPMVGVLALGVVCALSVVGCFTYYPPSAEAFEEIQIASAETLGSAMIGHREHAEKHIPIYEDWVRKLQVGVYLRGGRISEFHRLKAEILLDRLELLEHELAHDDRLEIRRLCTSIERSRSRLQRVIERSPVGD